MPTPARAMKLHLSLTDLLVLPVYGWLLVPHLQAAWVGNGLSLIFALQNLAVLLLLLGHRPAQAGVAAWSLDSILAWAGTLLPLALQAGVASASTLAAPILVFGAGMSVVAILSLGRSMGMEPANRGLKTTWMYRLVRHPIYATYLLVVAGFLMAFPVPVNLGLAAVWVTIQLLRIVREERLLARDPAYRDYQIRVPYRLIPLVW